MSTLHVKIMTPERIPFDGSVASVTMQSAWDSLAVLPGHIGLITLTEPGQAILKGRDGQVHVIQVGAGTLQVHHDRVTILVDSAA